MFSVVIPTYNHAEYLEAALKSVLDQTFQDFEVIVVNNYSTDHTLSVIDQLGDPRVQVINFRNQGVIGASRNVGIKASRSPHVAFLDSDDTWDRFKLEKIAQVLESDPEIGLICHDQVLFRDGTEVDRSTYGPPPDYKGSMYDYLLRASNGPSTSATVVARQYLEEVGYFSEDPVFVTVEDYDLWFRLARVCRFRFIREVLGAHRYHSTSATSVVERHLHAALAVLDKHCGEIQSSEHPFPRRIIRYMYARTYYGAARQYQRQGDLKKAIGFYAQSIRTYPFYLRAYAGLCLMVFDTVLGQKRRKRLTTALWGPSWRWG